MTERVTVSMERSLARAFDTYCRERGYQSRSEALRDLLREYVVAEKSAQEDDAGLGVLVYVYNHTEYELARRLTREHHEHHDLEVATLHVHTDHEHCMEVVVLRGRQSRIRAFGETVIAQRGVCYGKLQLIPANTSIDTHCHGHEGDGAPHEHWFPKQ